MEHGEDIGHGAVQPVDGTRDFGRIPGSFAVAGPLNHRRMELETSVRRGGRMGPGASQANSVTYLQPLQCVDLAALDVLLQELDVPSG